MPKEGAGSGFLLGTVFAKGATKKPLLSFTRESMRLSETRATGRIAATLATMALILSTFFILSPKTAPGAPKRVADTSELSLAQWPMSDAAKRGQVVYGRYCLGCHGQEGAGDGAAAAELQPRPRNFQRGHFKFRSTPSGKLPKEEDLMRTITCGLPGSSMPAFHLVPEPMRRDVAQYVLHLATFRKGKSEVADVMSRDNLTLAQVLETKIADIKKEVWKSQVVDVEKIPVPPSPPVTAQMLADAKARYEKECAACHGVDGTGNGPSSGTLHDWQFDEIRPRDFTTGLFRAGSRPEDLYMRMKTGLNGTPMPATPGQPDEVWGLAHYILSLKRPGNQVMRMPAGCADMETK